MGTCESLFLLNRDKQKYKNPYEYNDQTKNKGSNFYCAPIDTSSNNDNINVNDVSMSQTTMTMDMSQYNDYRKPQIYQYINKYKTNGLQHSVVKASLVELGNQGNSLVYSNIKNSKASQTNSLYTSKFNDSGYESSYDGCEMIVDGKMDEELVQKSTDKNTINNYNEFIKKKDNNTKNPKIMDYYKKNIHNNNNNKNNNNKNLDIILEESNNKEEELSKIPSSSDNKKKAINYNIDKNLNNNKNINYSNNNDNKIKINMQKYIQLMGKY